MTALDGDDSNNVGTWNQRRSRKAIQHERKSSSAHVP